MTTFPPTAQQVQAVNAFNSGTTVVIEAGAGSGKTSTLILIAEAAKAQNLSVLYVAFNKSIQLDAAARFPRNTKCSTAHALAYRAFGLPQQRRFKYSRPTPMQLARHLRINNPVMISDKAPVSPTVLSRVAMQTVKSFCATPDADITAVHVPVLPDYDTEAEHAEIAKAVVPAARIAWNDIMSTGGKLRYDHAYYMKAWQLSHPVLDFDVILLDEAQDTDPVLADVIKRQKAQLVIVGDRNQTIYGWRGTCDIMDDFPAAARVQLTKSFRFGPAVAAVANLFLNRLHASLRMTGHDPVPSVVGTVTEPDAILCRTNAGAITEVIHAYEAGRKVAMVGDGKDLLSLARAARELQATGQTDHADLAMFTSWGQVQDFVINGEFGSEDLTVNVKLIDDHTADGVIDAIERLVPERNADLIVSTAHKAKGREWNCVKISDDFHAPKEGEKPNPDELMLGYVTVTRAKVALDMGSLSWIGGIEASVVAEDDEDDEPMETPEAVLAPAGSPTQRAADILQDVIARAALDGYSRADAEQDVRAIIAEYLRQVPVSSAA